MSHEAHSTEAEHISWQHRLSDAVDDRIADLARAETKPATKWDSAYSLDAPGGAKIRLVALPTLEHPRYYMPTDTPLLDLGGIFVRLAPGTSVKEAGSTIYSQHRDDDVPLSFMIDTRSTRSVSTVSRLGEIKRLAPGDAHYEAFEEADGLHLYKLDESQQLHPVSPAEGELLVWQLANSTPAP